MNLNAINNAISKAFYKDQKIHIGVSIRDNKRILITVDGYVMWIMDAKDFIFDSFKLLKGRNYTDMEYLINTEEYIDATLTNELLQVEKKTVVKIVADDLEIYIDKSLLKTFDPKLSRYKVKNNISPILIYEGDILVGAVMPFQYNSKK